jgi:hypothetical protein
MKYILFLFLLNFAIFSCSEKSGSGANESNTTVVNKMNEVLNKTDSSWRVMMQSEERKIENLGILIKELGLIDGSSPKHLEQIRLQLEELKQNQYDRISMANSHLIDQYDSLTNNLLSEIRKEINQNKETIKYQVVNQLINEIQAADDSVLFLRKAYDEQIDEYKNFLEKHKDELKKLIPNLDSLKKFNYFRLNP